MRGVEIYCCCTESSPYPILTLPPYLRRERALHRNASRTRKIRRNSGERYDASEDPRIFGGPEHGGGLLHMGSPGGLGVGDHMVHMDGHYGETVMEEGGPPVQGPGPQHGSINGVLDQGVVRVHIDPLNSGGVDPINPHLAFALPNVPPGVEYAKSETCATVGSEQNSVADDHEQREYTMSDSER